MPSKKRKYEARFPPARIKKIMQTDEEIGKVAAAVPIIISRSLEIFLQSLVETTAQYTNERKAKTMTTAHLKHCIESEKKFDFLKDLVQDIADIANQEEEEGNDVGEKPKKQRKPRVTTGERKKRKKESSSDGESEPSSDIDDKPPANAPPVITTSNLPLPLSSTYSIDSIMGTSTNPPIQHLPQQQAPSNILPSFSTLQGSNPSLPPVSSIPMRMNLPVSLQPPTNDEDDDYDT